MPSADTGVSTIGNEPQNYETGNLHRVALPSGPLPLWREKRQLLLCNVKTHMGGWKGEKS